MCLHPRWCQGVIRTPAMPGPAILSPKAGETVARTGMLTVTYVPGTGTGVSGEINQSQGFPGGAYSSHSGQPDNGTYTMPKATALKPGAGWLNPVRRLLTSPHGHGFKAVSS